jgi:DNA-binding NarL/FixJ family response regulator
LITRLAGCPLSPRQCQLVRLLAQGYSVKTAARELHVSYRTAQAHRDAILERFGAQTIAEAVAICLSHPDLETHCPL